MFPSLQNLLSGLFKGKHSIKPKSGQKPIDRLCLCGIGKNGGWVCRRCPAFERKLNKYLITQRFGDSLEVGSQSSQFNELGIANTAKVYLRPAFLEKVPYLEALKQRRKISCCVPPFIPKDGREGNISSLSSLHPEELCVLI